LIEGAQGESRTSRPPLHGAGVRSEGRLSTAQQSDRQMMAARSGRPSIHTTGGPGDRALSNSRKNVLDCGSESGSLYEEMSWDPCSESQSGQVNEDEGQTSYQQARGAFTANASFGTMTHLVDHLEGKIDDDESELDNAPVDLSAVYVSLAPMSRAHPHEDSLQEITSPRQQARLQDDWAHTASNSMRVPFNTPVQPERQSQFDADSSVRFPSEASILQENSGITRVDDDVAMEIGASSSSTNPHLQEINHLEDVTSPSMRIGGQVIPSPLAPYMARRIQYWSQIAHDPNRIGSGLVNALQTQMYVVNEASIILI
jgi:hypothetical protein